MVAMMMMLVMVVHATTMILANSNVHLEGGQRQPPNICWNVTESLDELAKSQAVEHNDEPQRRTTVRQTDHSTILITALN